MKKSEETPDGLYGKYRIQRTDGKKIDPENEYFVLKLKGKGDKKHMEACRKAILVYAEEIYKDLPELANSIFVRYGNIGKSEVEPDNEKPYLFYEGEKYYFGEEYEFSDDGEIYVTCVFSQFDTGDDRLFYGDGKKDHGYFRYIRKIDHTTKYKKLFLELKMEAEKDGVNLKELI